MGRKRERRDLNPVQKLRKEQKRRKIARIKTAKRQARQRQKEREAREARRRDRAGDAIEDYDSGDGGLHPSIRPVNDINDLQQLHHHQPQQGLSAGPPPGMEDGPEAPASEEKGVEIGATVTRIPTMMVEKSQSRSQVVAGPVLQGKEVLKKQQPFVPASILRKRRDKEKAKIKTKTEIKASTAEHNQPADIIKTADESSNGDGAEDLYESLLKDLLKETES